MTTVRASEGRKNDRKNDRMTIRRMVQGQGQRKMMRTNKRGRCFSKEDMQPVGKGTGRRRKAREVKARWRRGTSGIGPQTRTTDVNGKQPDSR